MKTRKLLVALIALAVATTIPIGARADEYTQDVVQFRKQNLSGPRFGVTYVTGGELLEDMKKEDVGRLVSLFGWHFEYQIVPEGGGPQFVVETIPLVAGVEYGKFLPNVTLAMGVRFPNGIELGLGPSVMAVKRDGEPDLHTSLVIGVGKSFDYGGVSLPVTLAYSTNPDGDRVAFMLGYAISR